MKTFYSILLLSLSFFALQGKEITLDLSKAKNVKYFFHADEKESSRPAGTVTKVTKNGIELDFNFNTPKHDAIIAEFPVNIPAFSRVTAVITVKQKGHRPFIVLTDKNGENHYFSLRNTRNIAAQAFRNPGKRFRLTTPIRIKNDHPGEYFAFRWGGDNNQRIDFPIKKIALGLNDYPDTFQGKGSIIFHSLIFQ